MSKTALKLANAVLFPFFSYKNDISDYSGCRDTVTKQVTVTGISGGGRRLGKTADESLKVYPNPASSTLHIDYSLDAPASFQIMNLLGQQLRLIPLGTGEATVSIRTANLPAGIYIYRFVNDKGEELKSGKLILTTH